MRSVLITGANGQLGMALHTLVDAGGVNTESTNRQNDVSPHIASRFEFHFTDIDTLDIYDKSQIEAFIKMHNIEVIINCAAYTAVDKAEDDVEKCMQINCAAVRNIGEAASRSGARVIHISTDYVFDGKGMRPYREDDTINPVSVYGSSKLAGEKALLSACHDAVIIRTAWLYSETGSNFVKTMLRLGKERDTLGVIADQKGTPTYAGDLARAIITILEAEYFTPGIYNYSNEGVCTWYDFAVKIFKSEGIKCSVNKLSTSEYPTPASRPQYSVLDKSKIKAIYNVEVPFWEDSLKKCLVKLKTAN